MHELSVIFFPLDTRALPKTVFFILSSAKSTGGPNKRGVGKILKFNKWEVKIYRDRNLEIAFNGYKTMERRKTGCHKSYS